MIKKLPYIIALLTLIMGGFYFYNKYRVAPKINFNELALTDLNGNEITFSNFKGKKTIVCFSASWCGNCIKELGSMSKLVDNELSDVQIIVVDDEPVEKIIHFKEKRNYPYTFLKLKQTFSEIGIHSIPVSYFFNSNLELKKETVGEINWNDPSTREHFKKIME